MARNRGDVESKIGHVYSFVESMTTISAMRIDPGDPVMVTLYRGVSHPNGKLRGEVAIGTFTLDETLEYLTGVTKNAVP